MLLIITSTDDELLTNVNINDLNPKIFILSVFWQISAAEELSVTKWMEIDQDYQRTGTAIGSHESHQH